MKVYWKRKKYHCLDKHFGVGIQNLLGIYFTCYLAVSTLLVLPSTCFWTITMAKVLTISGMIEGWSVYHWNIMYFPILWCAWTQLKIHIKQILITYQNLSTTEFHKSWKNSWIYFLDISVDVTRCGEGELEMIVACDDVTIPSEMKKNDSGWIEAFFIPRNTGIHKISMTFNGEKVPGIWCERSVYIYHKTFRILSNENFSIMR